MLKLIEDFQLESSSNDNVADLFIWVEGEEDIPDDLLDKSEVNAKAFIVANKEFYKDFDKVYLHFIEKDAEALGGEEITMFPYYLDEEGNIIDKEDE